MRRRRVLQTMAALPASSLLPAQQAGNAGGSAVEELPSPAVTAADIAADSVPRFFSQSQRAALRRLCDLIAPRMADTPGALDAHAPEFLDFLISESPAATQKLYREGLDRLNQIARERFRTDFAQAGASQADELLASLREPWSYHPPADPLARFLRQAKIDILDATINSSEWVRVVSRRSRGAGGIGTYWRSIE